MIIIFYDNFASFKKSKLTYKLILSKQKAGFGIESCQICGGLYLVFGVVELTIAEMACVSRNIRRTFHVPSGVPVQRSISERDCSHPVFQCATISCAISNPVMLAGQYVGQFSISSNSFSWLSLPIKMWKCPVFTGAMLWSLN